MVVWRRRAVFAAEYHNTVGCGAAILAVYACRGDIVTKQFFYFRHKGSPVKELFAISILCFTAIGNFCKFVENMVFKLKKCDIITIIRAKKLLVFTEKLI